MYDVYMNMYEDRYVYIACIHTYKHENIAILTIHTYIHVFAASSQSGD